jgi:malate dehydrogenase (oxaloacetate-decarboxylating)
VDRFVTAVKRVLPRVLLQWEDFARDHAAPLLERYRDQLCTFNDDIQGTAAVVGGSAHRGARCDGGRFRDQQIVIAGAGSAAWGLAAYLLETMRTEGLSDDEARRRLFLVDREGLIHDRLPDLTRGQRAYAQPFEAVAGLRHDEAGRIPLEAVLEGTGATVLLGVSAQCGLFGEKAVRTMAAKVDRPIIFPLSNPMERCEATPHDLLRWTDGRALIATGSPYAPVTYAGVTRRIAQCNNVYVFPAVGLGVLSVGARRVTDGMMLAAARAPRSTLAGPEGSDRPAAPAAGRAPRAHPGRSPWPSRGRRRTRDGRGQPRGRGPRGDRVALLGPSVPPLL